MILDESAGTKFAGDLRTWLDDTGTDQAMADSVPLAADCTAVGVATGLGG